MPRSRPLSARPQHKKATPHTAVSAAESIRNNKSQHRCGACANGRARVRRTNMVVDDLAFWREVGAGAVGGPFEHQARGGRLAERVEGDADELHALRSAPRGALER